jgi:hypothetical protein
MWKTRAMAPYILDLIVKSRQILSFVLWLLPVIYWPSDWVCCSGDNFCAAYSSAPCSIVTIMTELPRLWYSHKPSTIYFLS